MSCGLGAVILIFILVKQDVEKSVVETDLLQAELEQLQQEEDRLSQSIEVTLRSITSEKKKAQEIQSKTQQTKQALEKNKKNSKDQQQKLAKLVEQVKKIPPPKTADVVQDDQGGEENYLMGLKVEGRRIVIMVDSSASMTDEKLLDIIRRKSRSDADKKKGPKWQRTKRIVRWLVARLPIGSQVSVVSFNKNTLFLGGANWLNGKNANVVSSIYRDLDAVVPKGATNLQAGLMRVKRFKPTDVYIITDGLPTAGNSKYKSLNPFAKCSSLWGSSSKISGECRVKLFRQTIKDSAPGRGVRVNVILLPIEGDPQASPEYWEWTSNTGGLLISPAESWP